MVVGTTGNTTNLSPAAFTWDASQVSYTRYKENSEGYLDIKRKILFKAHSDRFNSSGHL